ncbi:fibroleukin-like [Physella acuta]|uniref:fibroleukin-like n=1 Tax=Physella acuta TaxID=109671 RepID=UPI0027DC120C|nr:fibroleukin-like [Physella acuta]
MSVYRISEPEGKILVASISEADSNLQDYNKRGIKRNISKSFAEIVLFLSKHSDCNGGIFLCEIHYVNKTGSIDSIGKETDSLQKKSRESYIIMNLKAKTSDYVKSVDTLADFLKSFEDPDRLKGADMTMSLQMLHSGGDKSTTEKRFSLEDTVFKNDFYLIPTNKFENMMDKKIQNLSIDVNKTLQILENKLNTQTKLNINSLAVLNESIQTMLANTQNQTEQLSVRLNEMETKMKKYITTENVNTTLNLVDGLNKTLQEFTDEYKDSIQNILYTTQCVRNDNSSLPERLHVKLNETKQALCDTKTDGGGWIVIQRRVAGDVNFTRNWNDYKNGFGSLAGDYWLGNDWISKLTKTGYSELRFDMKYKGKSYYAVYSNVTVGNEADLYRIKFTFKTGNVIDSFSNHYGMAFSTFDKDNDGYTEGHCAQLWRSGWWFNMCHKVNTNGAWASKVSAEGINWEGLTQHTDSLEQVEMKLRRL